MNGGRPLAKASRSTTRPFIRIFSPLRTSCLARACLVAVLVQRLLAALTVWKLVEMAVGFTAERVWVVALPLSTAFMWWKFWLIAAAAVQ